MGFRFLSDDGKVAVVGSAKTKDNTANGNPAVSSGAGAAAMPSETGLTTVLDAVELTLDGKEIKNLDNFSDATRLVVDGIMIPLLPTESGDGQADKGENGKTAFIYETTYTPESDEKTPKPKQARAACKPFQIRQAAQVAKQKPIKSKSAVPTSII